jgi:hypothetical protein
MLKKSLSVTITIATLLIVLWQTEGTTQVNKREIACSNIINGYPSRDGFLKTKWNNGRTYEENVVLTVGTNGAYLNWENSQDKFLVNTNGSTFELVRGQNWQTYRGVCQESDSGSRSTYEIEGSAYSYPDNVAGTFVLRLSSSKPRPPR